MQTTFLVELGFWLEGLEARHYKNHIKMKGIEDKMGMTLWSLKIYGYIDSKIKSYQIQKKISSAIYFPTFQILAFRPHTFRLPSLTKHNCLSLRS